MRELNKIKLKDVLYIDIETSTTTAELDINSSTFDAWAYSNRKNGETDQELADMYKKTGALNPDFGRVVCISVGMVSGTSFKTTTFNNIDERTMIKEFYAMLDKFNGKYLCGHYIKGFDIPYIAKRGMINNLIPHDLVDTSAKKPWEMDWIIDTKELWQMGSYTRTSLITLTNILGVPSPKQDITGAEVPAYFWLNPKDHIKRISEYCERDVVAVYDVLKKLKNLGTVEEAKIEEETLIKSLFDGGPYGVKQVKELKDIFDKLDPEDREKGYVVLNAVSSAAKGKKTKITKAHIKKLKESYGK